MKGDTHHMSHSPQFPLHLPNISISKRNDRQHQRPISDRTPPQTRQSEACGGRTAGLISRSAAWLHSRHTQPSPVPLAQVNRVRMREERGGEGNREGQRLGQTGYRPSTLRPGAMRDPPKA
uniref:Uncharacterized protein n=1 Tax=Knipowitschia caucasica TaxID=637954 RepID=A0AAV2J9N2_KNICA